jgi:UDP-N-acetylmuramate dehydrogenase
VRRYLPYSGREPSKVTSSKNLPALAEERGLTSRLIIAEPLSKHTSFRIGGPADFFTVAENEEQLREWVSLARELGQPCFVIGNGTNLLVADGGFRGLVIENHCSSYMVDDNLYTIHAESGIPLARLARRTAARGLEGLEWAIGIPGTLGGAIVNNAGAYEGTVADCVHLVTVLDQQGQKRDLSPSELRFGYRASRFREPAYQGEIILSSDLSLAPGSAAILKERMEQYTRLRRDAQPREPSAGSVFKNPEGLKAAELIDRAGLRGTCIGDAEISRKHANYIVNRGQATAHQVWQLVRLARDRVWELFDVRLEMEIELVGEWPDADVS